MLDPTGRVETWNTGAELVKGYKRAEILGQHIDVFYTQEDRDRGVPAMLLAETEREGRVQHEGWRVRKDGTRFWAEVVITALRTDDGDLIGYAKVTRDLTERRRLEDERLRRARADERFRVIVDSVKDYAIFMLSPTGHIETWNRGAELIKGYQASEIIGKRIDVFYPPADRERGKPDYLLGLAVRDGRVEDEGWRVKKDGTLFWADVVITALRSDDGALLGFTKVTRDLTLRRAAEEDLRRSEERFRLLIDSVEDYAIFMLDPQGRVATWNVAAERINGYPSSEIIGQHFSVFRLPEEAAAGRCERGAGGRDANRPVRRRGLARPQGRHAILGERHHHGHPRQDRRAAGVRQGDPRPDRAAPPGRRAAAARPRRGSAADPGRVPVDRVARAEDPADLVADRALLDARANPGRESRRTGFPGSSIGPRATPTGCRG